MAQIHRQAALFSPSIQARITVAEDHELVRLEKAIDWDRLIEIAISLRLKKIKAPTGPTPHYRELLGAVTLMAVRKITFREAEDQIAHYAPARYLCELMESRWNPDHITIFDFTQMLGDDGLALINQSVLKTAEAEGFLDSKRLMSDTTAQEARIPYPTEVGLMANYAERVMKGVKKAGATFIKVKEKVKSVAKKVKALVRSSHLFAKTKEQKAKIGRKLYHVTHEIHRELLKVFESGAAFRGRSQVELKRLTEVMKTLFPQMLHFLKTGFVAPKKIIHLKMSELYSIVRGKSGKSVEFGLKWGINRLGGGFLQGFLIRKGVHASDTKFCLEALRHHQALYGEAPRIFGFDRSGYSQRNIKKARKLGVKHVGIAPKGQKAWAVSDRKAEEIRHERAQVEGAIGTIKSARYGFNRPDARSTRTMKTYGQRAILGFNIRKLIREQMNQQLVMAM